MDKLPQPQSTNYSTKKTTNYSMNSLIPPKARGMSNWNPATTCFSWPKAVKFLSSSFTLCNVRLSLSTLVNEPEVMTCAYSRAVRKNPPTFFSLKCVRQHGQQHVCANLINAGEFALQALPYEMFHYSGCFSSVLVGQLRRLL